MSTQTVTMTVITASTLASDNSIRASASQGLSSGLIAGVSIGVTCVVLAVAILSRLFFQKRRRNTDQSQGEARSIGYHHSLSHDAKELPRNEVAAELATTSRVPELDGNPVAEME